MRGPRGQAGQAPVGHLLRLRGVHHQNREHRQAPVHSHPEPRQARRAPASHPEEEAQGWRIRRRGRHASEQAPEEGSPLRGQEARAQVQG